VEPLNNNRIGNNHEVQTEGGGVSYSNINHDETNDQRIHQVIKKQNFGFFKESYSVYIKLDENEYWSIQAKTKFRGQTMFYFDRGTINSPRIDKNAEIFDISGEDLDKLIEYKDYSLGFTHLCDRILGFYSH